MKLDKYLSTIGADSDDSTKELYSDVFKDTALCRVFNVPGAIHFVTDNRVIILDDEGNVSVLTYGQEGSEKLTPRRFVNLLCKELI